MPVALALHNSFQNMSARVATIASTRLTAPETWELLAGHKQPDQALQICLLVQLGHELADRTALRLREGHGGAFGAGEQFLHGIGEGRRVVGMTERLFNTDAMLASVLEPHLH